MHGMETRPRSGREMQQQTGVMIVAIVSRSRCATITAVGEAQASSFAMVAVMVRF
jgi:hypothetical protein